MVSLGVVEIKGTKATKENLGLWGNLGKMGTLGPMEFRVRKVMWATRDLLEQKVQWVTKVTADPQVLQGI